MAAIATMRLAKSFDSKVSWGAFPDKMTLPMYYIFRILKLLKVIAKSAQLLHVLMQLVCLFLRTCRWQERMKISYFSYVDD